MTVTNLVSILPSQPYLLAVALPSSITTTITNIATAGQIIGGSVALVILVIAGVQLMLGGRNSVEMGKTRLTFLIIGMAVVAGAGVIKGFIDALMAF